MTCCAPRFNLPDSSCEQSTQSLNTEDATFHDGAVSHSGSTMHVPAWTSATLVLWTCRPQTVSTLAGGRVLPCPSLLPHTVVCAIVCRRHMHILAATTCMVTFSLWS